MEDSEEATKTTAGLDRKCSGRLDFNVPFLSTRRPSCPTITTVDIPRADACDRVPFSWEQTPGKPKDIAETNHSSTHDAFVPLPKPPPARWLCPREAVGVNITDYDDGFEGDVDDDFSDAIDVFSLSESIEVVDNHNHNHNHSSTGVDLKTEEVNHGAESPCSFMIQRFLPDATALAASSALSFAKHLSMEPPQNSGNYCGASQSAANHSAYSTLKGCGLDSFFPWRIKHKLCGGLKSPVISQPSPNAKPLHRIRFRSRKHLPHRPRGRGFGCFID